MTDKTTRWAFTAYENQYAIIDNVDKSVVAEMGFQDEVCPETGRKHRQGYIRTHRQVRFSQMLKILPGIHVEVARNWEALQAYCRKNETRDASGSQVHKDYSKYAPARLHEILELMASLAAMDHRLSNKDRQTDRQTMSTIDPGEQYWLLVPTVLKGQPELIGILAQPLPQNAWKHTRMFWIEKYWDEVGYEQ